MSHFRRLLLRLLNVFRRTSSEDELGRELASHLALLEEEYRRRGMSPDEARAAARRAFGGVEQAKEIQREARSFRWLDDAKRDVVYAARTLSRAPGFTATAVLTLSLGIGAVTVIYSLVRNVVLEPFPYPHSRRMVDVFVRDASNNIIRAPLPPAEFLDFQEQSTVFEDVAGALAEDMHYMASDGTQRVAVVSVTPNTFTFLGATPLFGRVFGAADAAPDAPKVAVLNHRTWTTLFGADPNVVGRTVVLNRVPRTIIGVMRPRFEWHVGDFWIPSAITRSAAGPAAPNAVRYFQARLRPGVTVEEAEAQLNVIAARRKTEFPQEYPENSRVDVITIIDWVVGQFRRTLYTLFGAVGLLLLIACCNVANMLLARATAREREITVRAALGASRGRIVRQLLVESALLAGGGLAIGTVFAYLGIDVLARFLPRQGVPWETQLRLDRNVLVFAVATAALATLVFGVVPAFQAARRELIGGTNSMGRSGTASRRQMRMRGTLVVLEVALSVVLLLGAGLLMRNFFGLVGTDIGIDPRNVLLVSVSFPPEPRSRPERNNFFSRSLEGLQSLPGVTAAAVTGVLPPSGGLRSALEISGTPIDPQAFATVQFCSEQYFDVMRLRTSAGRTFSREDVTGARKLGVVNEAFVRRHFSSGSPLGQTVRLLRLAQLPRDPVADPTFEIVGVVHDAANQGMRQPVAPHVYVPFLVTAPGLGIVIRTTGDPAAQINAVRQEIRTIDPEVAVVNPRSMEEWFQRNYFAQPRFSLLVLAIFAATGLLLVALGVYGVMAYTVSQQTRDIAIRMALGGERSHVLRMVFRTGMGLLGVGTVVGVAASVATNRLVASQLPNLSPHDPRALASVVALIATIGVLACWVPARRAMRVQPMTALRHE